MIWAVLRPSWSRLGAILSRLGAVLGRLGSASAGSSKIMKKESPEALRFGLQNGPQKGRKRSINFELILGVHFGKLGATFQVPGACQTVGHAGHPPEDPPDSLQSECIATTLAH